MSPRMTRRRSHGASAGPAPWPWELPFRRRRMSWTRFVAWATAVVWASFATHGRAADDALTVFAARDSLNPAEATTPDEAACLAGLVWKPAAFDVRCETVTDAGYQAIIRFPSPIETGNAVNDSVSAWWYHAQPLDQEPRRPAMVVVHESGSAMPVAQLFAKAFAAKGVHAILVHLPHYQLRRTEGQRPTGEQFLLTMRQAIADVRRARDAVAVLPGVQADAISVQGTSLGGFVTASAGALDTGFDQVFVMVAGGDLLGLIQNGRKEAADLRERLEQAGYAGDRLRDMLLQIEPNRLARRLRPERTWLYSALQDTVVPQANSLSWAAAASLPADHHVQLWGDHVTTIVYLPVIVNHVIDRVVPTPKP
jgi:hypothetical protein